MRTAPIGLLLGLFAACGQGQQTEPGAVQRRDSAGIVIIETPGALARAPIGWSVGQVPELQLGSAAGSDTEQFHEIGGRIGGGITGLPDGRIVVVNGVSAELLYFGRDGRFLNRLNKKGNGPGEFRRAYLIPYASNDSLLIRDTGGRGFTLLSSDGQMHRRFTPQSIPQDLLTGTIGGASEAGLVFTLSDAPPLVEGQQSRAKIVRWISLESGRTDTVARFNTQSFFVPNLAGTPFEIPVLFTTSPSATVGVQGFFVTGGDTPDVRAFDNSGRLIRIFRVAEVPRSVKPTDVKDAIDFRVTRYDAQHQSGLRHAYQLMKVPKQWPAFQAVRVDRVGWIWAELFRTTSDTTQRWMVFDSSGVARGVVDLPPALEVQDIGSDYVLGRWRDDLRVEYVRRYRLERSR
jgi:hypothetical protein